MKPPDDTAIHAALADATFRAYREAVIRLPPDVLKVIRRAAEAETSPVARGEFANILKNIEVADELGVPLCQDTGIPVVYLTIPPDVPLTQSLYDAVATGVRRATKEVPLRPNVVDPLSRHNTKDNTGAGIPAIHVRPGDTFTVTVLPKGAGAENSSRTAMLLPSHVYGIEGFVVETMLHAEGKPCPPVFLGVGYRGHVRPCRCACQGGAAPAGRYHDGVRTADLHLGQQVGIGPMGLGGDFTALAVKVKTAGCHTASLPVAVNVQCWANRHATVEVKR